MTTLGDIFCQMLAEELLIALAEKHSAKRLTIYKELWAAGQQPSPQPSGYFQVPELSFEYRYSFWSAEEQQYVPLSVEQTRMLRAMGAQIVSVC